MPGPVPIPCRHATICTMCPHHWTRNHIHRVCWEQPMATAFPWSVSKIIRESIAGPRAVDVSRQCHLALRTNAQSQEVQEGLFINTTQISFHHKVSWKMSHTFIAYSIFYSSFFSYRICLPQTQRWSLKWNITERHTVISVFCDFMLLWYTIINHTSFAFCHLVL